VFGNLYLTEKIGAPVFTAGDEHMAVLLAAVTAAAVDNARLHEESARLLEEVQALHRTRERFFAMVNHELRNALAAVFGWSEMLVRKKDPATVPRAAFEVLDSAQQAIGLINDLLDLSRLDEDRLKPVIRPIEPGAVARRAIVRVTPAAEARRVRLELESPPGLPPCETDASRLEQILVNLLGNAIAHTAEATAVRVTIAPAGRWWSTWWRTKAPASRRTRSSESSTSTSPRRPAKAAALASASHCLGGSPDCSAESSARSPSRATAAGSSWNSRRPPTMKKASRRVPVPFRYPR
jgi:Osmosensitive K+ channel histidine kinase